MICKSMVEIKVFDIPKILDERGNLSFIEKGEIVNFDVKRVYWIYDVPGGETRGGHAFKEQEEVIVALSGSFDVVIHDGVVQKVFSLNRSYLGLYIPGMCWRHMENFSTNAVCLVLASTLYSEDDYVYDFNNFLKLVETK